MKIYLITILSILLTVSPFLVFGETASVTVSGVAKTFDYTGTGVTITSVDSDLDSMSLILTAETSGNPGILQVTFDRSFFDSKIGSNDDPFIILADGDEPTFEETSTTATSRTLRIEVPIGTEEIEIIGTNLSATSSEPTPPTEEPTPPTEEPTPPTEEPTPPTEEPTTEPKPEQTPETPKIVCGEGTVLQDGLCVLDKTCGEGTILKDGVCVLAPVVEEKGTKELSREGMIGIFAGFAGAGIIAGILALISKGSKSKN